MLINSSDSFLLVIDVQDRLAAHIHDMQQVSANITRLVKCSRALQIPILCTEHCAEKIGHTTAQLMSHIDVDSIVKKTHFSACMEPEIADRFAGLNRKQVIITGVETHVCVLQTTLSLKQSGYQPFLVADGTSSRKLTERQLAIARMQQNAVDVVSTEMVVFEWLQRADTDSFSELLPLIKDSG